MNTFLFVLSFSKKVQILKTEYKHGQYCTSLSQSPCRYFFVLAINIFRELWKFKSFIKNKAVTETVTGFLKSCRRSLLFEINLPKGSTKITSVNEQFYLSIKCFYG